MIINEDEIKILTVESANKFILYCRNLINQNIENYKEIKTTQDLINLYSDTILKNVKSFLKTQHLENNEYYDLTKYECESIFLANLFLYFDLNIKLNTKLIDELLENNKKQIAHLILFGVTIVHLSSFLLNEKFYNYAVKDFYKSNYKYKHFDDAYNQMKKYELTQKQENENENEYEYVQTNNDNYDFYGEDLSK